MNKLDLASHLLWTQLWQSTLLLVVIAGVSILFARKRPHLVYLLWAIFFVKCLTPPVLQSPVSAFSWVPPDNSVVAKLESERNGKAIPYEFSVTPKVSEETSIDRVLAAEAGHEPNASCGPHTNDDTSDLPKWAFAPPAQPSNTTTVVSTEVPSQDRSAPIHWNRWLVAVWGVGVCLILVTLVIQWIRFFRRIHRGREETPDWLRDQTRAISIKLAVHRKIRLVVTSASVGPFVVGWLRPKIILPAHMLSDEFRPNLDSILAHELCHVRRSDPLISIVQCAAQILFWFHPLAWWANRQANQLCELCCDEETIESLQIRKRDYANSLLAVVGTKRQLRPVWATTGMSQAENTKQRLREIMKSKKRIAKTPLWCRLVAAAVLITVLPSSGYDATLHAQDDDISIGTIREALGNGDFEAAEKMCRHLIKQDENDAMAIHLLGFTLHGAGKLDEAVKYHKQATQFDATRAHGFYNLACVHALRGESEQAIVKLKKSIEAGLTLNTPITSDSDFESMYDHPEFKKIAAKLSMEGTQTAGRPSNTPSTSSNSGTMQPFAFWVGDWEVVNTDGTIVGTNRITMEEGGNLMHEKWSSASGGTGQSINYFDPETKMLKQTWVDSKGQVLEMKGKVADGEMNMKGTGTVMGQSVHCKMMIKKMDDGRVKQVVKISKDKGENWEMYFEGFYERKSDGGSK